MANNLCLFWIIFVWIYRSVGTTSITTISSSSQHSSCGNWASYTDEKCLHIVDSALIQTKEEAEVVCATLADIMKLDDIPRVMTVRTEKEQRAIQKYLFEEIGLLEPVWLGLDREDDGVFRWNNGADMSFSNLAKQNVSDADKPCIQMESGEGIYPMGTWVRVNCRKRNVVVCEKIQVWTMAKLQNALMNLKYRTEIREEEKQPHSQEKSCAFAKMQVPMGFIYSQLPGQDPPTKIWPKTKWTDVSSSYAGLFFRVIGGNAAPFGQTQEDYSPRLDAVEIMYDGEDNGGPYYTDVPHGGGWSGYVFTGDPYGLVDFNMRFRMSSGEVRPRNKAMVIWKRTG